MQNHFNSKKIYKSLALFLSATAFSLLAGCGDGGTAPTTTTTTGGTTANAVQLMVSSQQILTSSIASTDLTAVVLDATGQAVAGKVVTFSKGADSTAYFSDLSGITSSNGVATAKLNLGTDMTNRVITVTATADAAVGSSSITATGTKIAISGNTSLALNAPTTLTIIVKDSAGIGLSGITVAVASQNGNPIVLSPASGVTDANGQITATVTAANAGASGTDVLTVTGAGASQPQTLTINNASFAFTAPTIIAPATTPEIVVNTATPVSVLWTNTNVPVADGTAVNFYTSRGTITASATTVAGVATASITAPSTGATIITASANAGGTPAATLNAVFITTDATNIVAQANPGTVAVNSSTSTSNQSVISVVVRDAFQNLVKNAEVVFTSLADPSGGSLAAGTATTDITGTASVNYIAGSSYSCQNCVQIKATVNKVNGVALVTPISAVASLTVASQSLYVRLATDNKIFPDTPVQGTHTKKYTALVTDAAGNPAPDGTEVRFVLRPPLAPTWAFEKGIYTWDTLNSVWSKTSVKTCVSEDADRNNIKGAAEDINGNGALDPLGVATVNATATTNSGFAIANVVYSSGFSTWVKMDLEGRAGTAGNDPPNVVTFELPGLATDYTSETPPPPGRLSPFGSTSALCTNTD